VVAMQVPRSYTVPPGRIVIRSDAAPETPGEIIRQAREKAGLSQYGLAALLDPPRANDAMAMKNLQSQVSRYESDSITRHDPAMLANLERALALPPETLDVAAYRTARWRQQQKEIKHNNVAIGPVDEVLVEHITQIAPLEAEDMVWVTNLARALRDAGAADAESFITRLADYLRNRRDDCG
jgi:transcriptional regulator with XRE-family HTH domain